MENTGEIMTHVTTGAVAVYAIEWAKRTPLLSWVHADTKALNRALSGLLAVVAAVGIGWSYDSATGTLVVNGLTWGAIVATGWEAVKQFVLQQILFDTTINRK